MVIYCLVGYFDFKLIELIVCILDQHMEFFLLQFNYSTNLAQYFTFEMLQNMMDYLNLSLVTKVMYFKHLGYFEISFIPAMNIAVINPLFIRNCCLSFVKS